METYVGRIFVPCRPPPVLPRGPLDDDSDVQANGTEECCFKDLQSLIQGGR